MIRRQRIETKINHERWLVSYADFITLLFAFFVVMYSVSQVNETKYRTLSETLESAFSSVSSKKSTASESTQSTPNSSVNVAQLAKLESEFEKALSGVLATGEVTMNGNQNWVEITIDANTFFAVGKAAPVDEARKVLADIAEVIAPFGNAIAVGGHTDNDPINNAEFKNNWELSSARAVAVVNLLSFEGVDPARMSAVGYGEHRPIADNTTEAGRSANRRVVLRVERDKAQIPKVAPSLAVDSAITPSSATALGENTSADTSGNVDAALSNEAEGEAERPETVEPVKLRNGGLLFTSDPDRARSNR